MLHSLTSLPKEIILLILQTLDKASIRAFAQSCKYINATVQNTPYQEIVINTADRLNKIDKEIQMNYDKQFDFVHIIKIGYNVELEREGKIFALLIQACKNLKAIIDGRVKLNKTPMKIINKAIEKHNNGLFLMTYNNKSLQTLTNSEDLLGLFNAHKIQVTTQCEKTNQQIQNIPFQKRTSKEGLEEAIYGLPPVLQTPQKASFPVRHEISGLNRMLKHLHQAYKNGNLKAVSLPPLCNLFGSSSAFAFLLTLKANVTTNDEWVSERDVKVPMISTAAFARLQEFLHQQFDINRNDEANFFERCLQEWHRRPLLQQEQERLGAFEFEDVEEQTAVQVSNEVIVQNWPKMKTYPPLTRLIRQEWSNSAHQKVQGFLEELVQADTSIQESIKNALRYHLN